MATQVQHSYPIFEKNQVLTHNQLNLLASYLEEQGRLTRTGLIGIGIVCGLKLTFEAEAESDLDKDTIHLSEGIGITSEGFLISLCDCAMTQYRSYSIDDYVNYLPFQDPETGNQDIELWELLSDDFSAEDSEEDVKLLGEFSGLEEKVVLLFVEILDKDLKSCLSKGCDEIGVERKLNIRKLLIGKSDLEKVLERTGNEGIKTYAKRYELEDYTLKKPAFDPSSESFDNFEEIGEQYAGILFAEENNPVETILNYWHQAYEAFKPVLKSMYEESPFADPEEFISVWNEVFEEVDGVNYTGIQYYYDFVKDLVLAYREFRETSFDLLTECSPDKGLFPQHLILGELTDDCIPSEYRQQFIQTPVYSHQRYLLGKTLSLFARAVRMAETFNTNIVRDADEFKVKITPSVEKMSNLTDRAIPYYYEGIKEDGDQESLEAVWNYELKRRCALGEGVPAYENNFSDDEEADVPELPAFKPLLYDRDRYNFYRIEGGLGKPCGEVIDELNEKINSHNLSFDLIAVRTDESTPTVVPESLEEVSIDYSTGFHDLHEDYYTFRYQLANFFKTGLSAWELYRRFEEHAGEDEEFSPPIPDDLKDKIEEVYRNLIDFMCRTLPPCLDDFIEQFEEFKDGYAGAVEYAIDYLLEELSPDEIAEFALQIDEITNPDFRHDMTTAASWLLYQVIDILFFNRLYRIYYSFRRREYYHALHANRHRQTFSEFIDKHPGIDHMAGVPAGGTYVLLYGDAGEESQRIAGDFALPYRCCHDEPANIPICDDEAARQNIQVAPYARPDFGFAFTNQSTDIDLARNDHELYDLENEYCTEEGEEVFQNIIVTDVEGTDEASNSADIEILDDQRTVRFTPPEGFTGILKFRYRLEKVSNGLADDGIVTILVHEYCKKLTDFEFDVREGDVVRAVLDDFPTYFFRDPEVEEEFIEVTNHGEALEIEVVSDLRESFSFDYTAFSEEEDQKGCGIITLNPNESEEGPLFIDIITQPEDTVLGSPVPGPPAVRVVDAEEHPVEGVNVKLDLIGDASFMAPEEIPTDQQGVAAFSGITIQEAFSHSFLLEFSAEGAESPAVSNKFQIIENE